jgi:hypothetical protein
MCSILYEDVGQNGRAKPNGLGRNGSSIEDNPNVGLEPRSDPYCLAQTKPEDNAGAVGGNRRESIDR